MESPIYLIIIAILFIIFIGFLIAKFILYPIFFKPNLNTSEIIELLNKKNCSLIDYKTLNKKEKQRNLFNQNKGLEFDDLISIKTEYKIIGFSQNTKQYKIFWTELQIWLPPFRKRNLNLIEEKNNVILKELQKEYRQEIISITDKCPACNSKISGNQTECKNCGLNLVA